MILSIMVVFPEPSGPMKIRLRLFCCWHNCTTEMVSVLSVCWHSECGLYFMIKPLMKSSIQEYNLYLYCNRC